MKEVTLKECHRKNFCIDCDDKTCLHAKQAIADCPFYKCDREPDKYEDCESCELLKQIYAEGR